jgi:signal transduction histidine kinase
VVSGFDASPNRVRLRGLWPAAVQIRQELRPIVWLLVGQLTSFIYLFAASFEMNIPLPLFPPQAVILSVLLLTSRRHWWLYLLIYYAIQVVQGMLSSLPLPYYLSSNIGNVLEPLVGASLFRRFVPRSAQQFAQLRNVGIYVASVTLGSVVGATWGASIRAVVGFPFWESWPGWFLADVLASLVLAPTIVLWATSGLRGLRSTSGHRLAELALLCLAFVVVGRLVFTSRTDDPQTAPALLYLLVPLLVWAAVRFGPQGLMTALAVVTVMAITGVANNLGPFQGRTTAANLFSLQLFLLGIGVPLFLLAALIRERQQAQARLAQSEARYRVMVRSLPHGSVLLFGPDLQHQFADGQGLPDVGLTKDAVEGRTLWEAFPVELATALEPRYRSALAGEPTSFELMHGGRQYQMYALSIPDVEGPTGMLVMHDVTEQKRAEVLAELDRAKTAFFSNVSHELRTPLTLVLGPLQDALIGDSSLSGHMLHMVHRNVLRLQRLVNALLDFSRIEADRVHPAYELTDVSVFTADLTSNFRSVVEGAGLKLVVNTPPLPEDMPVYIDRDLWEKVVLNLLSNAFNHTFDGEISVSVRPADDRQHVELQVRDTGIGIAEPEQARIFDRFHRVQGVRSRGYEGSGIGLALVQELVSLLGGSVSVESKEGRGSTFSVRMPVGTAHISPEHVGALDAPTLSIGRLAHKVDKTLQWVSESRDVPVPDGAATRLATTLGRILVADDNPDMRRYVSNILSEHWIVQTASDGRSALHAALENPPDLLLLDVMMPEMDGFQVLAALRENPATQHVPIIMLSARAGEEATVEGLVAGADDYVIKPFASAELSARVATQAKAARARATAEAAVKERDEFVALVVHDLRHPLANLNWHIEAFRSRVAHGENLSADQVLDLLTAIDASGKTLSAQIDELRDATHLQAGRPLDLRLRPTDLVELARAVVQQHEDASERFQFRFETAVATLTSEWDAARLERVVENLLSNAQKYSPNGGAITVRVARDGDLGVLSVEDHGLGIPAVDLPRIFEPYSRGSNVTGQIAGSGLGLAGARGIVEQHGGMIAVTSTEGEGSTFAIRLPLSDPDGLSS